MADFTFLKVAESGDDVVAEARATFAAASDALEAAGLTLRDLVKVRLLYTDRSDFPQMNSVRDPLYRSIFVDDDFPSATGVCTGGTHSAALPRFEMEVIAAPGKEVGYAEEVVRRFGEVNSPYAHVNVAAGAAFLSGQTAFDTDGVFRASGPVEEAEKALATFGYSLAQVGRRVEDIVAVTTYLKLSAMTDDEIGGVLARVGEFVSGLATPAPVVTCVGVDDLAFEGMTIEIEAIAGMPGASTGARASGVLPARWSGGLLAGGSTAVCSGGLVVGSATAESAEEAGRALGQSVAEVGGTMPGALLTAWYSPQSVRETVARQAAEALPDAVCSLVPMASAGDDGAPWVTLELFGNAG
jgi:enamine deaminase RidA (YjgF/YER057c/UK114 family)